MRVLFSTSSPARYMQPPLLGDQQVNCGPDWPDAFAPGGEVISLNTPAGDYDLAAIAAKLPPEQAPDVVVCLVDASWRNKPHNLAAFRCPRVVLIADTHHLRSPLIGMMQYVASEPYDRAVFLYDRHHASFFHAAGFRHLHWFPGLTFPHDDVTVRAARKIKREARVAFVGQAGNFHPRRARLLEALASAKVPVATRALAQRDGFNFYGWSLVGFNASLNGDLNLRAFEILASGAALLTDRLAPDAGLEELFPLGQEFSTYADAAQLVEQAVDLLAHPAQAHAIGQAGAAWFDANLGATQRREAFRRLAFDGVSPFAFNPTQTTRVFFGGDTDRLLQSLMVYEGVQELHRKQETVRVAIDAGTPVDVTDLCATLPRVIVERNAAQPDLAVVSREATQAAATTTALRLWCWNATPNDFSELADKLAPAGFGLASTDVAVFCRPDNYVASGAPEPATDVRTHVLLYTDDAESGGVAQYNHTLLGGLVRAGYRVSCVQSRAANPLVTEQRAMGVEHHWLDYHTGREFARTVSDGSDARRIFESAKPDLVIFSDCCPVSNLAARECARQSEIPYVVVVGFVGAYLARNFSAQLPALHAQYAAARAVVAVSEENLHLLRSHFGLAADRGEVIHYGRPEKFFAPRSETTRVRLRAELHLPDDAVVCFTAARLAAVKGFQYQIEAARVLAGLPGGDRVHFVWAGEGDQRGKIEAAIAAAGLGARVHLLGQRWDVADWYDAADIFCLPSDLEGMPLAIMEAMAKSLPVVATSVSGIPEELGGTGRLLPSAARDRAGLVEQLARTLHQWAIDTDLRSRLGAAARERADHLFREAMMLSRTLELTRASLGSNFAMEPLEAVGA